MPILSKAFTVLAFKFIKRLITRKFPTVEWIATEELARWLKDPLKPQPILLDARTEAEYAVSHLEKAERIDPHNPNLATIPLGLQSLHPEVSKDTPIVVYCSVGYRSARIAERLGQAGFSRVYNLEGSIFEWANVGRPVFKDGNPTMLVHPYNHLWGKLLKSRHRAQVASLEKRTSKRGCA